MLLKGRVVAVSCDHAHRFSKLTRSVIRLIAGHGVEGDVHAGRFVKHRYLARRDPEIPNIRQILLIPAELFEGVQGPRLNPGQLGENITTSGIDLHDLPLDSLLHLGRTAVVALTGLRTPCGYIDKF